MDIEFTVEKSTLYMLQCRVGKRTARAAVVAAVDMVREGLISKDEAVLRVEPARLEDLLHAQLDPRIATVPARGRHGRKSATSLDGRSDMLFLRDGSLDRLSMDEWGALDGAERNALLVTARFVELGRGLPASPGAAAGEAIFDPDTAAEQATMARP